MAKEIKFSVKLDVDGQTKLAAATTSAKDLQKALDDAKGKATKFNASLLNFNQVQQAFGNIKNAISSVTAAFGAFTEAANNAEVANQRLTTVMQERMNATEADVKGIKALISEQTSLGVVSGTAQKAAAQQVATFLTQKESLEQLIPAMNNLIAQQNGVGASAESAQSIGNLFGKVMQGQTSALKRVGITFDETQEKALKFGSEEERAAVLAQVVNQNVGNMNEALGKTAAGRIQQLSAKFAGLKVQIGQFLQQFQPVISAASGIAMFAATCGTAVTALKGLAVAVWTTSSNFVALAATQVRAVAVGAGLRIANYVLTGSFAATSAATVALDASLIGMAGAAQIAKVAIRGLLIATGVGAAIAGLTMGIEALMNVFDGSAKEGKKSAEAIEAEAQAAKKAAEENDVLLQVKKNASGRYSDERAKVKALTEAIHDNALKYEERMKAIKSLQAIIPSYHAQIAKDGSIFNENSRAVDNYIKKLDKLALAEAAFEKIKEIEKQIIDQNIIIADSRQKYKEAAAHINENDAALEASRKNDPYTASSVETSKAALAQRNKAMMGDFDNRTKWKPQMTSAAKNLVAAKDKKAELEEKLASVKQFAGADVLGLLVNGGATDQPPSTHLTGGKGSSVSSAEIKETPALEGSLADYDERILELKKAAQATNDVAKAQQALNDAAALQKERDALAVKIGLDKPDEDDIQKTIDDLTKRLQETSEEYAKINPLLVEARIDAAEDVKRIAEELAEESAKKGLTVTVDAILSDDVKGTLSSGAAQLRARRDKYNDLSKQGDVVKSDYSAGLISEGEAQKQLDALNKEIQKLGDNIEPITLKVDTKQATKSVTNFADVARSGWSSIKGGVGAVESATESLKGNESAWKKTTAVIDGAFQLYNSVVGVIQMVTTITKALGLAKKQETKDTTAASVAATAHAGAATADATATTTDTTAKTGNAMASAAKSGASLPFPANIAAIAAGVAAVMAVVTSIASLAFETGGIVPGTSPTGDKMTVRVNSGEMILNKRQQANLWRMANTRYAAPTMIAANTPAFNSFNVGGLRDALSTQSINVNVRGKMSGRDIKLVTDKRNTLLSRS